MIAETLRRQYDVNSWLQGTTNLADDEHLK